MTVDQGENSAIVTEIFQKVHSPVAEGFFSDLRQIFHQSGPWNWEAVVMKSGFLDLYVTGKWNNSIFDYYRKRFQIHSLIEDSFPSFTLILDYTNRIRFYHHLHFPLLARAYTFNLDLTPISLLPILLQISMQDEFVSNCSYTISKTKFYELNGVYYLHSVTTEDFQHVFKEAKLNLQRVNILRDFQLNCYKFNFSVFMA